MCGIVGYCGPKNPKEVLLSGLKTLEYRGYDSAGVSILNGGHFSRVRASGKLAALEKKLQTEQFDGHIGIGHTRWATHGAPSERNAHPHTVGPITLVHNGIIENYLEIRDELREQKAQIESDTDSELVAHLIARVYQKDQGLLAAVNSVRKGLQGAFSILVASEHEPDTLVAFKCGPPLVVGISENESVVASDVQAILPYTDKVVYLEDNEVAVLSNNQVQVFDSSGREKKFKVVELDWSQEVAEKKGFPHFMLKEIYEQPRAVAQALEPFIDLEKNSLRVGDLGFGKEFETFRVSQSSGGEEHLTDAILSSIERVFIVACGTSYYAGMVGEYIIENWASIPVEVELASEFRYRNPVLPENSLVVLISQSGETADTLAALRLANQCGALTVSLCNVKSSSIDREANGHLYMRSGVEIGVASTKAFTSSLAVLNACALYFGKLRGKIDGDREYEVVQSLLALPSQMEKVIAYDSFFAQAAQTLKRYRGFLYMGRHVSYPIALEGALKLKELAYMHAEGYAAGEMKHGPIALIDKEMCVVVIAPDDQVYDKTLSNLEEVRARGGRIISIGTESNDKLKQLSEHYLALPKGLWSTNPILSVLPLQLLAYHVAHALGHDVDQPRNLAKSVTVE